MCEYAITGRTAGEEGSSTFEGRYLTIVESELIHPYHSADGLVDKGDPVRHGDIVGVAMTSAVAATDLIAIDTEGIWYQYVYGAISDGTDLGAAGALAYGDQVYIQRTMGTSTTLLSGQNDPSKWLPFGKVLGAVTSSLSTPTLVAVKVHGGGTPTKQMYIGDFTNPLAIDVTAAVSGGQNNPGWLRAFLINSTIIAATKQLYGAYIRVENVIAGGTGYMQGLESHIVQNATGQLANMSAIQAVVDNMAGAGGAAIERGIYVFCTGSGTASAIKCAMDIESSGTAGTLQGVFNIRAGAFGCGTVTTNPSDTGTCMQIPIIYNGVQYYLLGYNAAGS